MQDEATQPDKKQQEPAKLKWQKPQINNLNNEATHGGKGFVYPTESFFGPASGPS
ncbi:hypothetical protein [Mariprofundus sp. NF]|uniref:hypothetical protein n=1 Tax=Mariprofundus sp. NF TaxID=2608716 RepID=UPI0015A317C1|nr:hypothetical protein [Mariprofundus sp. NF]